MSDSVDRVFVHALNTVKRIPRMGSHRPPPSDRLKLYGLYKQSMEGDVDGVMERPRGDTDEMRAEQEKWDAWNHQKGLSRTEAKRQYISTLIDTMHRYASNTSYDNAILDGSSKMELTRQSSNREARELVSELEFVWDQIKNISPASSSGYSYNGGHGVSPNSRNEQPIYPVSDRDSRHTRGDQDSNRMRVLSPVSQSQIEDAALDEEHEVEGDEREEYVDAQDSQVNDDSDISETQERPREQSSAEDIVGKISRYVRGAGTRPPDDPSAWQKRIEHALIKMNAEMAALREQVEWQHKTASSSSMFQFPRPRRKQGLLRWILDCFFSLSMYVVRHLVVDATIIGTFTILMYYYGIPVEKLEHVVLKWLRRIQQSLIVRQLGRIVERMPNIIPLPGVPTRRRRPG